MGLYLSQPKTEKQSADGENHKLRYGLSSMQGWRSSMEDAHVAFPNLDGSTSFFGVYDGHGGNAVAKFCAKYLHQEFLQHEAYGDGDLVTSIQKTFLRMDQIMCDKVAQKELIGMGDKKPTTGVVGEILGSPRKGEIGAGTNGSPFDHDEVNQCDVEGPTAGTTACVVIIQDNKLVVANAGDSRCIISRQKQAYDLSTDHKPYLEGEEHRILEAGGFIQGGRVNGCLDMARAIGDMQYKQNKGLPPERQMVTANPDVNVIELCENDEFLVLACDGVWECMSSQELVDFIHHLLKTESRLSAVCEKVLDHCLAPSASEKGCDNMTMILVQLKKASYLSSHDSSGKYQAVEGFDHFSSATTTSYI